MTVTTTHPEYLRHLCDWELMEYSMHGERCIKEWGELFLPKSSGMIAAEVQDPKNKYMYHNFKHRAEYPHWVKDSLRAMIGLAAKLDVDIHIDDDRLESLEEQATNDGFSLKQLFLRLLVDQMVYGRVVMLLDFDKDGKPYISTYGAKDAINWKETIIDGRKDLSLSVLRECRDDSSDEFGHEKKYVFRVLDLVDGEYRSRLLNEDGSFYEDGAEIYPSMGNDRLNFIPIVYCGSTQNTPKVDEIPLMTMARSALKYYEISAEYYQELHMTSHPQPWISGVSADQPIKKVTGPSAAWMLPQGGACGYLEIKGTGIEAKRTAMNDKRNAALEAGARVMDSNTQESGTARQARQDDQYSTLYGAIITASEAIEQILKYAALWLGIDEEKVRFCVKPDFGSAGFDAELGKQIYEAVLANKISMETYWNYIRTGKLPEASYEKELIRIEEEQSGLLLNMAQQEMAQHQQQEQQEQQQEKQQQDNQGGLNE